MRVTYLLILLATVTISVQAQTTEFTYQGNLVHSGMPANGNHDFEFLLYDTLTNGTQLGSTLTRSSVAVSAGSFSVKLDFGQQFPGGNRFLEIRVKQSGGGAFVPLTPRQQINSAPYAIKSVNADTAGSATNAATATNALQLGGIAANQYVLTGDARLSDARNPLPGSASYIQNQNAGPQSSSNFNISGNGIVGGTLTANTVTVNNSFDFNAGGPILYARGTTNNPSLPPSNTFVGVLAGVSPGPPLNGFDNSSFGYSSGSSLTNGNANSFFGSKSGLTTNSGFSNSFFGAEAGSMNTAGSTNSFFGSRAGISNTTGGANSFFGEGSGIVNSIGSDNSFVGRHAGGVNSTGSFNTFVGSFSGSGNDTGNNNSLLGYLTSTLQGNLTNATAIGWRSAVGQNNSLVLGSISGVNGANVSTNVGIGTATPTERLHVVGNGLITGNLTVNGTVNLPSFAGQFIQNSTNQQPNSNFNITGNGIVGGSLSVGNANTSARVYLNRASVSPSNSSDINFVSGPTPDFSLGTSQGSAAPSDFSIYNYGTGSNIFTIQRSTGLVGVGTTTPVAQLHVISGANTDTGVYSSRDNGYAVYGFSPNGVGVRGISSGNYGISAASNSGSGVYGTSNSSFGLYGSSTSNSGVKGESFGNMTSSGVKGDSANGIGVWGTGGNAGVYGVGTGMLGYGVSGTSANSYAGYFSGNVHVTGILTQNSDDRLKQNINTLTYGLPEVLRLRPTTWLWKDRPDRGTQLGFIAQEVEPLLPELVSNTKTPEQTKALNYVGLLPVLVNAIKEQQAQIEQQKRTITSLQEELTTQRRLTAELKAAICELRPTLHACKK